MAHPTAKRSHGEDLSVFQASKKRKPNHHHHNNATITAAPAPLELITSARQLQGLLSNLSDVKNLQRSYQSFRNFLQACVPERENAGNVVGGRGADQASIYGRLEADVVRNAAILREWVEIEASGAGVGRKRAERKKGKKAKEVEEEEEDGEKFQTLVQGLGFASQASNSYLLSSVASALALLVRITSTIQPPLTTHGATLCGVLLEPTNMKFIYRGITSHQDRVASPMLRLLTEINKFNFGQLCGALHSAFDFTVKDLGKNLEAKRGKLDAAAVEKQEDSNKPALRTIYVRFILSFFQFGSSSVKADVLGQRALIMPMFKYIKSDPAMLVHDILEVLKTKAINDSQISRVIKTQVFNEWILGHISALYTRPEPLREAGDQMKTVATCAHEFLQNLCTKPGIGGVCFPDNGWYPPGTEIGGRAGMKQEDDGDNKHGGQKIYNRTLAAFITTLKPYADVLQQDLLLEIFQAAPELVARYFTGAAAGGFTLEPKLTATWIGYCTFLTGLVSLPLPKGGFGLEGEGVALMNPPPAVTVVESVLPKVCTRVIMAKCMTYENALVRFLSTNFLVAAFEKLRKAVNAIEKAAETFTEGGIGASKWLAMKEELVEEFSRRMPDMASVVAAYNSAPIIKTGGLHREVASRLLMQYYELVPEMALGKRFDVNIALGGFLEREGDEGGEDAKGMRFLEMEHLLRIAKEAGDVKWWNKAGDIPYSSFTLILKLCINTATGTSTGSTTAKAASATSLKQVKEVLGVVLAQTQVFQDETAAKPFDALIQSLAAAKAAISPPAFKKTLTFLDDCLIRCVRTPFKYLDDFAEAAVTAKSHLPLSPLVMTLIEQFKFLTDSSEITPEQKKEVTTWLLRFFENLVLAGENPELIHLACEKLCEISITTNVKPVEKVVKSMDEDIRAWVEGKSHTTPTSSGILNAVHQHIGVRSVFPAPGVVDLEKAEALIEGIRNGEIDATAFDVAVLLNGLAVLLNTPSSETTQMTTGKVMDVLEMVVLRGKAYEEGILEMKKLVGGDERLGWQLISGDQSSGREVFVRRYIGILQLLFSKGWEVAVDPFINVTIEALKSYCYTTSHDPAGVVQIFSELIRIFFPDEGIRSFALDLSSLCASKEIVASPISYEILAAIVKEAARRKIQLNGQNLTTILQSTRLPEQAILALAEYISTVEHSDLSWMNIAEFTPDIGALEQPTRSRIQLLCALVRKAESMQEWAVRFIGREVDGLSVSVVLVILKALLDTLSVTKNREVNWKSGVSSETKQTLEYVLQRRQEDLLTDELDNPDVLEICRRAISLFPSLNASNTLSYFLMNKRRNNFNAEIISFVSPLLGKHKGNEDIFEEEKKAWFLMAVDHLTRRFGEEKILTQKSASCAREFAALLGENDISLGKCVPRGSLNALLEAAVGKIDQEDVVGLASMVVSRAEAKDLDLAKLLQMMLGNPNNPLAFREYGTTMIHYHMAYLIHRLFTLSRSVHANITTMDGVMLLYRGTCTLVDKLLLDILMYIEGHLTISCASRVATWGFIEDTTRDASVSTSRILISRSKTKLAVNIDEKLLQSTLVNFTPSGSTILKQGEYDGLEEYSYAVKVQNGYGRRLEGQYDQGFMLPVLAYLVASQDKTLMTGQAMVGKGGLGFAVLGLCSEEGPVRRAAVQVISAVVARLEESAYRARNQVSHLCCAILASLEGSPIEEKPMPTVVGSFFAHTIPVLTDPGHFLYDKLMEMLLRSPLLDLWDIPYMLSNLSNEEDYYKEVNWKLTVLSQGLRTETDLGLYRKRRVFESCLAMYQNPYAGERTKEKVVDLLWNLAEVKGGGTTAMTRSGVVSLVEQVFAMKAKMDEGEKVLWKKVIARLWETAVGGHVIEWSRGSLGRHLDEIFRS